MGPDVPFSQLRLKYTQNRTGENKPTTCCGVPKWDFVQVVTGGW